MWSTIDETSFRGTKLKCFNFYCKIITFTYLFIMKTGTTCSSNSNTSHKSSTNPSNKTQSTQVSAPPTRPQVNATTRINPVPPPPRSYNQNGNKTVATQKYWPLGSNSLPKSSNSSCSGQSINTNWSNLNLAEDQSFKSQLDKNNLEFARSIEPKNQVVISFPNHRGNPESKISNI